LPALHRRPALAGGTYCYALLCSICASPVPAGTESAENLPALRARQGIYRNAIKQLAIAVPCFP